MVQHLTPEWVELQRTAAEGLPSRPGATARLQHVVTGATGGEVAWSLVFEDGQLREAVVGRDDAAADCTFLITHADAVEIARGDLDLHAGFMQGRVKMSGAMQKLMDVLPVTQSEDYKAALARAAADTEL
ncbi:MAG: SCP2 sterol-binding domain-containing protein [Acidimicrobiales bacterium]|nr:SCP2 sterol-binding domain-containing protein [Acidimicrobiales bacterium]